MTYTFAIFGDAGNSLTNGTNFYYSPGKWERYQIGASAPLQASVNQMMQSWNPNDLIQLEIVVIIPVLALSLITTLANITIMICTPMPRLSLLATAYIPKQQKVEYKQIAIH